MPQHLTINYEEFPRNNCAQTLRLGVPRCSQTNIQWAISIQLKVVRSNCMPPEHLWLITIHRRVSVRWRRGRRRFGPECGFQETEQGNSFHDTRPHESTTKECRGRDLIAHSHSNIWPNQIDAVAVLRSINLDSNAANERASEYNTKHTHRPMTRALAS